MATAKPFVAFGELLIRLTATGGQRLDALPVLQPYVGGAEANVAIGLRRLGQPARMVSVLPDNELGEAALHELRRWGVDVADITTGPGRMGLYFLTPGAIHRPSDILYDREGSAFAQAAFDRLNWKRLLKGAGWLHVSGITAALGPKPLAAALKAVRTARDMGVMVSFDCNYRTRLWQAWEGDAPAAIDDLMQHADIVFGGYRDIELVSGQTFAGADGSLERNRAAADHAFARYPRLRWLASTRRTQISADHNHLAGLMFTRPDSIESKTYDIAGIIDRIGGGDAFAAGVLYGLLTDKPDWQALDYGIACACLKHAQPADYSLATIADLDTFLGGEGFDVRR